VDRARKEASQSRGELESLRGGAQAAEAEVQRLDRENKEQQAQLQKAQEALEDPSRQPAPQLLRRVKELEARKNLRLDLKSGELELLRSIDFEPRKAAEAPTAAFADPRAAERVLQDVAELEAMFKVPMVIEAHSKGASTEFWEQLATNRAGLIKQQLEDLGVEDQLVTARGLPGNKGVNKACIICRLEIAHSG